MTPETFKAATGCSAAVAQSWAGAMTAAMSEFGITTYAQQCAFIAQCGHESAGFTRVREIWGPTIWQQGYEHRADLGNNQPGDGFKYRGRGPIQITGRANYRDCGKALGLDLEQFPSLLEAPTVGARAAGWFWKSRNLNALADKGDFEGITRKINGGLNGLADRMARWGLAKQALL